MLSRRGSTLFIVFGIISVLFIMGVSMVYMTSSQITTVRRTEARLKARLIAESALEKAVARIEAEFLNELVHVEKDRNGEDVFEINNALLDLIDISRVADYARVMRFQKNELMPGSEAVVLIEARDVFSNEFSTYIDYQEKIPESLKVFQKPRNVTTPVDLETLGGTRARVKFTAWGRFDGNMYCIDTVKTLRVTDITPPAPDHTLFIHSDKAETLKEGSFVLSNLDLPLVIEGLIRKLSRQVEEVLGVEIREDKKKTRDLIESLNQALNAGFQTESIEQSIQLIDQLSKQISDDNISETVDNIILSLNPRNWGRVRTNGRLEVYLPFFAADDIINYFAESGGWRDLPEVGYLFHDNRLHDPYMSVYTHYEGLIYKRYRKIYPAQYGILEPEEVPPEQYTINTRLEYPKRFPQYLEVANLERLKGHGIEVASQVFEEKFVMRGTEEQPIRLDGIWYFRNGLVIAGHYSGRGMVVSEKPVLIENDLIKVNQKDSLSIVSLYEEVGLSKDGEIRLESAVYAHHGLSRRGTDKVFIRGNLAVEDLNRARMPRDVTIRFDYNIKNHMVDNLHGSISDDYVYYRDMSREMRDVFERGFQAVAEL